MSTSTTSYKKISIFNPVFDSVLILLGMLFLITLKIEDKTIATKTDKVKCDDPIQLYTLLVFSKAWKEKLATRIRVIRFLFVLYTPVSPLNFPTFAKDNLDIYNVCSQNRPPQCEVEPQKTKRQLLQWRCDLRKKYFFVESFFIFVVMATINLSSQSTFQIFVDYRPSDGDQSLICFFGTSSSFLLFLPRKTQTKIKH